MSDAARHVVEAESGDVDELARLEKLCLPDPWSRDDLALYLASGAVVAFRWIEPPAAHALGYAVFQLLPDESELLRLGVAPAARGGGRGGRLLAGALERLAERGHRACHLEVRAGNDAARALYERLGFVIVGRRSAYYADGEDAVRYRREARPDRG